MLTRRISSIVVVVISQAAGFIPLLFGLALIEAAPLGAEALRWGAAAGFASGTGVGLLYRGLAVGRMSVVAPVTGVVAATLPVVFAFFLGERPGASAMAGVVLALIAVVLVSGGNAIRQGLVARDSGLAAAFAAGSAFGAFFILLERAGDNAGLWSVLAARTTATLLFLIAAAVTRTTVFVSLRSTGKIAVVGLLDVAAVVLYVYAAREGLLSLVAVLTSMYPAMTVVLARIVLKERFVRAQIVGLALAAAGVILIALG